MNKTNIKLLFKILTVIFLIFEGCKYERQKSIENNDIKIQLEKYQNKEYGFSIEYPADWKKISGNQDIIFAVQMINDSLNKSFQNTIHITNLVDLNKTQMTIDNVEKSSIDDMSNSFEKFQVVKREKLSINNNEAIKTKCSFSSNNELIISLLYFVKAPNNIYLIALSSSSNDFKEYEEIYEYIAETFNPVK